jgi:hypothetical protein
MVEFYQTTYMPQGRIPFKMSNYILWSQLYADTKA